MKYSILIFATLTTFLLSCRKTEVINPSNSSVVTIKSTGSTDTSTYVLTDTSYKSSATILIDASKDGGVWWYPQSAATGFVATNNHQGKKLADYFRSLGFKVDEIGRGTIITNDLLRNYNNIIRAGGFGNYTPDEIAAYETFLSRSSSLLLLQDHLTNFPNDQLSASLGAVFTGVQAGTVTSFESHPITTGVSSFPFMMGSVIRNPDPTKMTILGSIVTTIGGETSNTGVMGVLHHPTSRIFFIGDTNGIETIPQPFTLNLIKWLFR